MYGDFRETIVGCGATFCRFNIRTGLEPTCTLKLIAIDETGRCRLAEGRPVPQPQPVQQKKPGHYEGGRWVE